MSNYLIRSPKPCSSRRMSHAKLLKKVAVIFSFALSIIMIVVIIWYTVHPSKPHFSLQDATVYQMNLSGGQRSILNSAVQITLIIRNPNQRVGIYYDNLEAYASYKGEQITAHSSFSNFYQGHDGVNVLSALLLGNSISVSTSLSYELSKDQSAGKLDLNVQMSGRLRWKIGTLVPSHHNLEVYCDSVMAYNKTTNSGGFIVLMPGSRCRSTV